MVHMNINRGYSITKDIYVLMESVVIMFILHVVFTNNLGYSFSKICMCLLMTGLDLCTRMKKKALYYHHTVLICPLNLFAS
uniref:Uncharacterized protein n=1 Tax=Arundo donax TaxID=35708 RepID=A0A0A9GRI5_ARUDO